MRSIWVNQTIAICLTCTLTHTGFCQVLDTEPELQPGHPNFSITSPKTDTSASPTPAPTSLRTIRAITRTTANQLRADSGRSDRTEQLQSGLTLLGTLQELNSDPRLSRSKSLQTARKKLMVRLRQIQKRTEADIRRRKRKPQQIVVDQEVLAQLNQAAGINAAAAPPNAANGNANQDYGTLLVNLIQRTISPNSWDANGGLSSIQYYRPSRALVVRAPQAVHDDLSPLLIQLRKQ